MLSYSVRPLPPPPPPHPRTHCTLDTRGFLADKQRIFGRICGFFINRFGYYPPPPPPRPVALSRLAGFRARRVIVFGKIFSQFRLGNPVIILQYCRRAARRGQGGRLTTLNFTTGAVTTLNCLHVLIFL